MSDGSSDQALLSILRWLLQRHSTTPFEQNWADLRRLRRPPTKLVDRIDAAIDLYPCDILVVHRDAERELPKKRLQEIADATADRPMPVACMVPVRMTEAWLLFDEESIRRAAGCPNGTMDLGLPGLRSLESIPDPKDALDKALRRASGLSGRRYKQFQPDIHRLADLIDDFSPLCGVASFRAAETSLRNALLSLGLLRTEE